MAGFKELVAMSDATFEEVLEEYGLAAKWEARGLERGREEAVKKLQKRGMDPEEIADILELPLNTVFKYLNTN
jgi:DNA-binding CsgD family transcriptional regulator